MTHVYKGSGKSGRIQILARSILFNIAYVVLTAAMGILGLPIIAFGERAIYAYGRIWCRAVLFSLRVTCGTRYEVRGRPPTGPCIVACKHQSAMDTFILPLLIDRGAFVLKRQLLRVPLVGWYFSRGGQIAIDRLAGAATVRKLILEARNAAEEGRCIVIFPEGTRVAPKVDVPYLPGVTALYRVLDVPLVPVALNTGLFWGRKSFLKYPGVAVIEFLEPMPSGLDRKIFMDSLRERIETRSRQLADDSPSA